MSNEWFRSKAPREIMTDDKKITRTAVVSWDKELAAGHGFPHLIQTTDMDASFYVGLGFNSYGFIRGAELLRKRHINQNLEQWRAELEQNQMEEKAKKIFGLTG